MAFTSAFLHFFVSFFVCVLFLFVGPEVHKVHLIEENKEEVKRKGNKVVKIVRNAEYLWPGRTMVATKMDKNISTQFADAIQLLQTSNKTKLIFNCNF
jgi:hypothetical protein